MAEEITPAADGRRLISASELRAMLGLSPGVPTDEELQRVISTASGAVDDFCNRVFAKTDWRQIEWLERPRRSIFVEHGPAEITKVTECGVDLVPADYWLGGESQLLYRLREGCRVEWAAGKVVIEYSAGYLQEAVPSVVKHAVALVARAIQAPIEHEGTIKRDKVDGVIEQEFWVPGEKGLVDPTAGSLLAPHVFSRPVFA